MCTPGGNTSVVLIFWTSASTALIVGMDFSPRCISTMPSTTSLSASWPAMPRRGRWPTSTLATSPIVTGAPLGAAIKVWRTWSMEWISPTPRTMAAWGPMFRVWPPTLTLALFSAAITWLSDTP